MPSEPKRPRARVAPTGVLEADVRGAHTHSIDHREQIRASERCGCFHCLKTFAPAAIEEWIDEPGGGATAMCPGCGIDSVIGSASGYPIDGAFLRALQTVWFGPAAPPEKPTLQ